MKAAATTEILTSRTVGSYAPGMAARREKPPETKKTEAIKVMVSPAEEQLLKDAAEARGLNLSAWVRMILLEEAKRPRE
jgi:hypothetical protein